MSVTLPFLAAFDHYSAVAEIVADGSWGGRSNSEFHTLDDGRKGYGNDGATTTATIGCDYTGADRVVAGFRYQSLSGSISGDQTIIRLDNTSAGQVVRLESDFTDGRLFVRDSNSSIRAYVQCPLESGDEYYIELAAYANATAGEIYVRINGKVVISLTSQDTGSLQISEVTFSARGGAFTDCYVKEWDGTSDVGWLGPFRMVAHAPDGDVSANWTPDTGTTNYTQVDEVPNDGDTTYVATDVDATEDQYSQDAAIASDVIVLAMVPFAVANCPAGSEDIELGLNDGVSDYGPQRTIGDVGYRGVYGKAHFAQPGTGSWTPAAANAVDLLLRAQI